MSQKQDELQLQSRVKQSLDFVERAVDAAIADQDYGDIVLDGVTRNRALRADGSRDLVATKVAGEAALLLWAVAPLLDQNPLIAAGAAQLHLKASEAARTFKLKSFISLNPAYALDIAAVHIILGKLGNTDTQLDDLLSTVVDASRFGQPERTPSQQLEIFWLNEKWGKPNDFERLSSLTKRSCLSFDFDILQATTSDIYALTHAILYASDFGHREIVLRRSKQLLLKDIDYALTLAVDAENFDLVAELLWSYPMLRSQFSAIAQFCFNLACDVFDEFGFLPGPEYSSATARCLPPEDLPAYELRTSYHTTLAFGLLCSTLSCGNKLCCVESDTFEPQTADVLFDLVDEKHGGRSWHLQLKQKSTHEFRSLAEFFCVIALRRARDRCDFSSMHAVLSRFDVKLVEKAPPLKQARNQLNSIAMLSQQF